MQLRKNKDRSFLKQVFFWQTSRDVEKTASDAKSRISAGKLSFTSSSLSEPEARFSLAFDVNSLSEDEDELKLLHSLEFEKNPCKTWNV